MKEIVKNIIVMALAALMIILGMVPGSMARASELATTINLSQPVSAEDGSVQVDISEDGARVITIGQDGTYELTGSIAGATVIVDKKVTAIIIFNNAAIDDSSYKNADPGDGDALIESVINLKKNSAVDIRLKGSSVIKCNPDDPYMENGIKHGKNDGNTITFSGDGSLTVTGSSDDAIKYTGGSVDFLSGSLTINDCYGDGIQAESINISDGSIDITTVYKNASTGYYTSGSASVSGKNTIWENGNTKYERVNVDTGSHKGLKAGTKAATEKYLDKTETESQESTKASGGITISGGSVTVDTSAAGLKANSIRTTGYSPTSTGVYLIGSPDDGIHSNNSLTITGGRIHVAASDDGITAAGSMSITGTPTIEISQSYEGIEGQTIEIGTADAADGPAIAIHSDDDGINSAGKTVTYTYDSSEDEDCNYLKESLSSQSGNNVAMYSGSVEIYIDSQNEKSRTLAGKTISYNASGDGIDCNGALDIKGGKAYIFGQSTGDNSPIDTNEGFTLAKEATVLAVGSQGMNNETLPGSGTASYITYTGSETSATAQAAGTITGPTGGGTPGGFGPGSENIPGGNAPGGGSGPDNGNDSGGNAPGGGSGPNSGNDPGGNVSGGNPGENPGGNPGGMPGQGTASISAGTVFTVKSDSKTLISKKLPYAASYIMFASSDLESGASYTISTDGTDADEETGANTNPDDTNSGNGTSDNSDPAGTVNGNSDNTNSANTGNGSSDNTSSGSANTGSGENNTTEKKADNKLTVKNKTVKLKYSALKKKAKTIKAAKVTKGNTAKTKITYKLVKANKKSGAFKVSSKGKITVKKGTAKGTYKLTIKAIAKETKTYRSSSKKYVVTVKIS